MFGSLIYNFGPSLIRWVKTLYKDIQIWVHYRLFQVSRGVRQGDPLASLLFILGLEVYLYRMKNDDHIMGLEIEGEKIKYTAYADDITCFCKNNESLLNVFTEFEEFSKRSGLINKFKTKGMWIGKNSHLGEKERGVTCPEKGIKVLGIYFSYDLEEVKRKNFDLRLIKMKNTLAKWKNRGLTLIGKIQILKTFIMSKIIYLLSNNSLPTDFAKEVEKVMFSFLWNGPDTISRATMYADHSEGGLNFQTFCV